VQKDIPEFLDVLRNGGRKSNFSMCTIVFSRCLGTIDECPIGVWGNTGHSICPDIFSSPGGGHADYSSGAQGFFPDQGAAHNIPPGPSDFFQPKGGHANIPPGPRDF